MNNSIFTSIKYKILNIDKGYLIIFGVALFLLTPILSKEYYVGHDTFYHIENIIAIDENLSIEDGILLPQKIVPIIANDFGYGSGIFYGKLPHYLAAYLYGVIKQFTHSFDYVMNIMHFITIFLAGIFMYIFSKNVSKNKMVALLCSVFYMTYPYLLTDIYVRDAFAESFMFIFLPMIFIAINKLMLGNKREFYCYFIIGYVGAVNSHMLTAVFVTMLVIIYMICNFRLFLKKDILLTLIKASIVILMFISPFILPMIEHKILGNYEVFEEGAMATINSVSKGAVYIGEYFDTKSYLFIGLIPLIMTTIVIFNYNKIKDKYYEKKIILGIFTCTIVSFLMTLKIFPWSIMPDMLINIQFPWRLNIFIAFGLSFIGSYSILLFEKKERKIISFFLVTTVMVFGIFFINKNQQGIKVLDFNAIDSNYGMGWNEEYLPTSAFDDLEYFENRSNTVIVTEGNAKISNEVNKTPYLEFDVNTSEETTLELPRLYYLGYKITLTDSSGTKKIKYFEDNNGFIEIGVNTTGKIKVRYVGTTLNIIGRILFLIASIISISFLISIVNHRRNRIKI